MFEAEVNPSKIEQADLAVCIPSYNEADSIPFPTRQASEGLVHFFPEASSVIINGDNDSPDHTKEAFLATPTKVPKIYISTPPGVKGKGNNLRNLFRKVTELGAKAVVLVDADLKSITPEWIKHLAEPLFREFSFVAPLYVRHKYDGTMTHGIAYPLTRALYGRRVRQPIGGEFGFSGKLARVFLQSPIWDDAVAHFGIDLWMTTLALNSGASVCQSFLGRPKIHKPKDPAASLGSMFRDVVGTLFSLTAHFDSNWLRIKYSKPTAIFGFGLDESKAPPSMDLDSDRLLHEFRAGFSTHGEIWKTVLAKDICKKLHEIKEMKKSLFDFPTELWARILYDTAVAFREEACERPLILDALVPLYFGRTFAFVKKTKGMSTRQAEETLEEDCTIFEMTKPYLIKQWLGKDGKR